VSDSSTLLISELLADPAGFREQGKTFALLEEYFEGLALDTLRSLLRHEDGEVQKAAVWIASELGSQACDLLDDVVPLIARGDRYVTYHALGVVAVCASGDQVGHYILIPQALESRDDVVRLVAMELLARASTERLQAAAHLVGQLGGDADAHRRGLLLLANGSGDPSEVRTALRDGDSLSRMYGAVAAQRLVGIHPELLEMAAVSTDPNVRQFVEDAG
jgi:hypothetical protein